MPQTATAAAAWAPIAEDAETLEFIAWTLDRFAGRSMVLTTQFGMEGCALIDMYAAHGRPLTVVYLDTMFLFPETYALRDRMVARYPHVRFENRGTRLTPRAQDWIHGPALWERDPDRCCRIRKVDPMSEALRGVDVWVTGLTRQQSESRATLPLIGWDWKFGVLKVNPLADWNRARVWEYVRSHDVPHNPMHLQGYPSIGCTHCTRPVQGTDISEYSRRGRWSDQSKVECGLHASGSRT